MRHLYLCFFLLCTTALSAESLRGFLLTKDNYQLTGYFNKIEYTPTGNQITFTNDFGDVYFIHPQLVKGFGFSENGINVRFISRYHEGQWFFLRMVVPGRLLQLYSLPDGSDPYVDDQLLRVFETPPAPFWLVSGKDLVLPVPRQGYKRVLRTFFKENNSELALVVGKKGYRYKDLAAMVLQFNEERSRRRRRL